MIEIKKENKIKAHSEGRIRLTHPITRDTAMNKTVIHPPRVSLLMFVIGTSRGVYQ